MTVREALEWALNNVDPRSMRDPKYQAAMNVVRELRQVPRFEATAALDQKLGTDREGR